MSAAETLEDGACFGIDPVPMAYALSGLGRAAYTLFVTPEHDKPHQVIESRALDAPPQPLHPDIGTVVGLLHDEVLPKANLTSPPRIDAGRLTHLGGTLIQFADYIPEFYTTVAIPYDRIQNLHHAVVARAEASHPLNYAEQFDTALDQTEGDVAKALWNLFTTSRLQARWRDGKIVQGMPNLSDEDKLAQMMDWRRSIAACKEPIDGRHQDPNGDTYYTWTHALAKFVYSGQDSHLARGAGWVFHHGTSIMHRVVQAVNRDGVFSDHTIASAYGNAIGQACVDFARRQEPR